MPSNLQNSLSRLVKFPFEIYHVTQKQKSFPYTHFPHTYIHTYIHTYMYVCKHVRLGMCYCIKELVDQQF